MQTDEASPRVIRELRTKQQSLESHKITNGNTPAMQKTLSEQFGLHPTPSSTLELNFDAFRYAYIRKCSSTLYVGMVNVVLLFLYILYIQNPEIC